MRLYNRERFTHFLGECISTIDETISNTIFWREVLAEIEIDK